MLCRSNYVLAAFLVTALGGCSASNSGSAFENGDPGSGSGSGGKGGGMTGSPGAGGDLSVGVGSGGSTGTGTTCKSGPNDDADGDGFTVANGDCNDCDPNVNPGAIEVVATEPEGDGGVPAPADEDCDGMIDNLPQPCDQNLNVADPDPLNGARALDLCVQATGANWGVVSAKWVMPDGAPPVGGPNFNLGHGNLSAFGPNVNVQAGGRMLGLSSGTARQLTDPGFQPVSGFDKGYTGGQPQGFPKESPACPGVITGVPHDGTGLEVVIRVPTNAHGFSFNFNFFTYEWPGWICSQYNDFFVALLSPIPMGQTDGNISFDTQGNPVSVNNAFLEVCGCQGGPPCYAGGKTFTCALGNLGLMGTGFGADTEFGQDHASTGWLVTKAPVEPGTEITMRWGVYDSGDGVLDTTTLIDNWQWIAQAGTTVGTDVVPNPK